MDTVPRSAVRRSMQALGMILLMACGGVRAADPHVLQRVIGMVDAGQFEAAEAAIDTALRDSGTDADSARVLRFQRERMRRILLDFSLTREDVVARLRKQIPDLTDADVARWDAHDLIEHKLIDGRLRYFKRAPSNLFLLSDEARHRRTRPTPPSGSPLEQLAPYHAEVRDAALAEHRSSVDPRHVRITQTLTVHADAVPAGETVRAWIPYPRALPGQQEQIRYRSSEPAQHRIAPDSALQRTVYFEKKAVAGKPTRFSVTYDLDIYAQFHRVDPDKVVPAKITPELEPFVSERAPHVVFTPQMRALSRQIVGDEKNPWRIAQKLFAAVDQIPWAGAREYSTIPNIGNYTLHAGHGDCGEQTLLLITLLRLNGIPARWQSGMMFTDGDYWNLHDWGQLYIAPYGWMPMDVTFGRLDSPDPQLAGFYLGGLDGYRVAFNSDYSRPFVPAKTHFRSETVDLQRGEAEWRGGNLYFDQWDYDFEWTISKPQGRNQN